MTYEDYRNIYGGLVREERFNAFLNRAISEVDNYLTSEVTTDHYDSYVCTVGEIIDIIDTPDVAVDSGASFRNYVQPRTIDTIIRRRLGKTGLIYQGV